LAQKLHPATVVGLVFSDVPGGAFEMIASGPTYYDHTTVEDAQKIVEKYNLGEYELYETPKDQRWFEKVTNIPLVSNSLALTAMQTYGEKLGYEVILAGKDFYDDVEDVCEKLLSLAKPNSIVIGGGEARLVISIKTEPGMGGRNTQAALIMSDKLADNQVFASVASDGIDNCRSAGGIVDKESDINLENDLENRLSALKKFDSYPLLKKHKDAIMTGATQSNISDFYILLTK